MVEVADTTHFPSRETTIRSSLGPTWWIQLAGILVAAAAVRFLFFVGFGLGDDLGYIDYAAQILAGHYPPLDPLNQYAYRPLLLVLVAAGIGVFGYTGPGLAAPALLASLVTTTLVFVFVRRLIAPQAAWWCSLLYALQPFNIVNSTTMTNDVILACLVFATFLLFLLGDGEPGEAGSRRCFAGAGATMTAAFLVKITILPALCALALYSSVSAIRLRVRVVRTHSIFYATFLIGLGVICSVYWMLKGDFLWQFRSELAYYEFNKPTWYLLGDFSYRQLMFEYPRSLFWRTGYAGFTYFEHGFLFWMFVPASVWILAQRKEPVLKFLVASTLLIFVFFQFYPQYLVPYYLPLVRQSRYLEMLVPGAVVVVGTALYRFSRARRQLALVLLCLFLGHSLVQAQRRWVQYHDSQRDVHELAGYAVNTVRRTGKALAVDMPAQRALAFYLRGSPVVIESVTSSVRDSYVVAGGARSFWWSRDLVFDIEGGKIPAGWILTYEVAGRVRPWRPTPLRVYYVPDRPKEAYPLFDQPLAQSPPELFDGLAQASYPRGFGADSVDVHVVNRIPDLDDGSLSPGTKLEWTAWLMADEGLHTFESTSDDGSWIYLNGKLLLDNGGTHPAKTVRRTVRLGGGWYQFRFRYQDDGGDRLLRFRAYGEFAPGRDDSLSFYVERIEGTGVPSPN